MPDIPTEHSSKAYKKPPRSFLSFYGHGLMKASGKSWGKYNQALAAAVVIYILLAILIPKWIWLSQWLVKNRPNFDLGAWVQLRCSSLYWLFSLYITRRSPYEIYFEQYRKHDKDIAEKDGAIKNL